MKPGSKVVVETAKHLAHLTKTQKSDFLTKVDEYATKQNFNKIPLAIPLRRRDEKDIFDSIVAYQNM